MKPTIVNTPTHHEVTAANGVVLAKVVRGPGSKVRALNLVRAYTR